MRARPKNPRGRVRRPSDQLMAPEAGARPGVTRRRLEAAGVSARVIEAGPTEASAAVVFLHGNPGSADDWADLVTAVGASGRRAVTLDLPDFGETIARTGFEHSVFGYAAFLDAALAALGIERVGLVVHDFGGPIGLAWAIDNAPRLDSVIEIDTGILPGFTWHRLARVWRTPVLGELSMALSSRGVFRRTTAAAEPRGLPREFLDRMYDQFDRRTRRAVLALYRSVDDPGSAAGGLIAALSGREIPALVIWGAKDAYLPASFAERQREAFPAAEVHVIPDSGHWPFVDSPDQVERLLLDFLAKTP